MWNDTDTPLAMLITFRCYGTWLHGDERGSVDKRNNIYGAPLVPEHKAYSRVSAESLNNPPVNLDAEMRLSVESAIKETCVIRKWKNYACNVRTNHAHAVIFAPGVKSGMVLHALKANATRRMREDGCWVHEHSPWVRGGSKRNLWNEKSVNAAIHYVLFGQGGELPDFG